MHKRFLNELRLAFVIEPRGPVLIKSGKESGADPTLLDMNFVRLSHAGLGRETVYLPGSSIKGTLRSYCERIARTVAGEGTHNPPISCNPLGNSDRPGRADYACGRRLSGKNERQKMDRREREDGTPVSAQVFAGSCAICRTFGNTALAGRLFVSDAYPWDPEGNETTNLALIEQTNRTEQRDGVAIDRVSGAVAVGPFNLEVVTRGAFYGGLTLKNFQLWQMGLLAIALRDLAHERVPLGFSKSRGLGRVIVRFRRLEVAYPGRFDRQHNGHDLADTIGGVTEFVSKAEARMYDYIAEQLLPLNGGARLAEAGDFARVALEWTGHAAIEDVFKGCVPFWRRLVESWRAGGG